MADYMVPRSIMTAVSAKLFVLFFLVYASAAAAAWVIGTLGQDASGFLAALQQECSSADRTASILCMRDRIERRVDEYGIASLMHSLEQMRHNDPSFGATQCHDVAHAIGQAGGSVSSDINRSISSCSSVCTWGCYHGMVEGYLLNGKDLVQEIPTMCSGEGASACYHGLGHGVSVFGGYKLADSLALCDLVPTREGRLNCGTGVFMELYEPSTFQHALLEFPEDIPGFCATLGDPYNEVCHVTAGVHAFGRAQDMEYSFNTCLRVPQEMQAACVQSLGRNLFFFLNAGGAVAETGSWCAASPVDWGYGECIRGALQASIESTSGIQSSLICQSASESFRQACEQEKRQLEAP